MTQRVSMPKLALLAFSLSAFSPVAAIADGASRVTWKPSYSSSCEDCSLVGQQMPYSELSGTRYGGANLSHASLFGSVAENAKFQGITGRYTDFSQANLNNANLEASTLTNARFIGAKANGANFSGAQLDFGAFSETKLIGANLSNISATHIKARYADFSAANATGAIFDSADLRSANFNGAQLLGASFVDADIAGAQFKDARLAAANLRGVQNFEQANFAGACRSPNTQLPAGLVLRLCSTN